MSLTAEHMGIPLLKPYLGIKNGKIQDWNPREGVNFAVGGATALDASFFIDKGIYNGPTNYSLGVQLDWFKQLLPSICNSSSGEPTFFIFGGSFIFRLTFIQPLPKKKISMYIVISTQSCAVLILAC